MRVSRRQHGCKTTTILAARVFFRQHTASELKVLLSCGRAARYTANHTISLIPSSPVSTISCGARWRRAGRCRRRRTGLKDGYFVTGVLNYCCGAPRLMARASHHAVARAHIPCAVLVLENFVATLCAALTIFFILFASWCWWRRRSRGASESWRAYASCCGYVVDLRPLHLRFRPLLVTATVVGDALQQMGLSLFCGMATAFVAALVTRVFTSVLFFICSVSS